VNGEKEYGVKKSSNILFIVAAVFLSLLKSKLSFHVNIPVETVKKRLIPFHVLTRFCISKSCVNEKLLVFGIYRKNRKTESWRYSG
jgi:hypothetical protein